MRSESSDHDIRRKSLDLSLKVARKIRTCSVILVGLFFSAGIVSIFALAAIISEPSEFATNHYTRGSDDYAYLSSARNAALLGKTGLGVADEAGALHAPAYPIILGILYSIVDFGVFGGLFFNVFALFFAIRTLIPKGQKKSLKNFAIYLMLMPGLLSVSLHLYKDIFLLLLTVISINYLERSKFYNGLFLAALSQYFRPLNGMVIIFGFLLSKLRKPSSIIFLVIISSFIFYFIFSREDFQAWLSATRDIALRDMADYGSSYSPSGNFLIDYLLGLARFFILPLPSLRIFEDKFVIFGMLEFFQSCLIWVAISISTVRWRMCFSVLRRHWALTVFTFLHASVYSVIYYGNSEPRFRLYFYILICYFLIECLRRRFWYSSQGFLARTQR